MRDNEEPKLDVHHGTLARACALVEEAEAQVEDTPRAALELAQKARDLLSCGTKRDDVRVVLLARALIVLSKCQLRLTRSGDAVETAETALEILGPLAAPEVRSTALMQLAWAASMAGDLDAALRHIHEGLKIAQGFDAPPGLRALLLTARGGVHFRRSENQEALECYGQALEIWRGQGDRSAEARVRRNQAVVWSYLGDHARALETQLEVLAIQRSGGDTRGRAMSQHGIANLLCRMGSPAESLPHALEAVELCREIGDREGEASSLQMLSQVQIQVGNTGEALDPLRRALGIFNALGCPEGAAHCHATSADLSLKAGDREAARAGFEAARAIALEIGASDLCVRLDVNLAALHNAEGEHQRTLDLLLGSEALRATGLPKDLIESEHELLHNAYEGVGQLDKALEHLRIHYSLVRARERDLLNATAS